jgi:hypothetical protein
VGKKGNTLRIFVGNTLGKYSLEKSSGKYVDNITVYGKFGCDD